MAEENKFAVFHFGDTGLSLQEGVFLFESEEDAEAWMEAIIRRDCAGEIERDGGCDTREDVLCLLQDSLGFSSYFHCYPVYEVPEP